VPPTDLREYVVRLRRRRGAPSDAVGVRRLLELEAGALRRRSWRARTAVAVHRTYVERLDAEPLTLDWPPAGGDDELAYEIDELIPSSRGSPTTRRWRRARSVRDLARDEEYDRLRRAAVVRDALDEPERGLLKRGVIDDRVREAERTVSIAEDVLAETKRE